MLRNRTAGWRPRDVESPAQAKPIERSLGPGVRVTASYACVRALGQVSDRLLRDLEA